MPWLLALVLASGAGIVGIGIVRTVRDRDQAQRDLRGELERGARATARLLAEALTAGPFPEQWPLALAVRVEAGAPVDEPPFVPASRPTEEGPDERSAALLDDARRLEFGKGDMPAARTLLESGVAATERPGALVLALAWLEERAGDAEARDRWLAHRECPRTLSRLLLLAKAGRDLGGINMDVLTSVDPELALGVFARIHTHAPHALKAEERENITQLLEIASVRRYLIRDRDRLALHSGPVVARYGDHLVLGALEAGTGKLRIGRGEPLLAAVAERSRIPFRGKAVLAHRAPEDAIVAVPDVASIVLPGATPDEAPPPDRTFWLLLVLAATFVAGGAATFHALRRESRAMAARAEFLTSVTHELKTPIAGIRLLAELLEEGRVQDEAKRQEYHHRIAAETMRLSTLIENVLDLGRIERGERAYDLRPVDLREIVREVHELFTVVAARDGMRAELSLADEPAHASVDRGAVAQALWNLLDNARKYARDGGRIDLRQLGGTIVVRDHGPGIPASERERVFAKFVRGARQQDGSVPGLGLGLHLARAIAATHGGSLVCRDPADGTPGTEFVLTLPLLPPPP